MFGDSVTMNYLAPGAGRGGSPPYNMGGPAPGGPRGPREKRGREKRGKREKKKKKKGTVAKVVSGTRALPKLVVVEVEGGAGQWPQRGR